MRERTIVHGEVTPGFEACREAFAANFDDHGDVGAAFCLYVDGRKVVDLWGGVADPTAGRAWNADTLQLVLSATKGAAAVTALRLVERGELDPDAAVADYWPEFAAADKGGVLVKWVLAHAAGLPALDRTFSVEELLDGTTVVEALAAQTPLWTPGSAHGYHSLTFGYLVAELVQRVTGRSLGTVFAEEIAGPLGLDFWIGLPPAHETRVSRLLPPSPPPAAPPAAAARAPSRDDTRLAAALHDPSSLTRRALDMSEGLDWNDPRVHQVELPSANGICTARSLARMYAATVGDVDGLRVLAPSTVTAATETQSEGLDLVMFRRNRYGLGLLLRSPTLELPSEGAFGHTGSGGSLGFADPSLRVGFGYVMNQMQQRPGHDPRTAGLIAATVQSLR